MPATPAGRETLGSVYVNRRMAALVGVGFASGLPYVLANDTIAAWLSALSVDVKAIGLFALITLPYTFKFLWAPLLDRFVIPGLGRRRGWLIVFQGLLVVTLVMIGAFGPATVDSPLLPLGILGVALVFLSASQDVVADAYRTDSLEQHELGAGAAVFVSGYRIATILAGTLPLVLAKHIGWRTAMALMGVLMAMTMVVTLCAPEPRRVPPPQTLGEAIARPVQRFIIDYGPAIIIVIAFVLLFRLPDQLANRMTMPLLFQHLKFEPEQVGWIRQALGFFITIIGALIGGALVARIGLIRSLIVFGVLQAISNGGFLLLASLPANLPLMALVIAVENFCNGLVSAGFVAFLMSCCDPRYSATQYALLTSLMAAAAAIAGAISGFLVKEVQFATFFALSIAAGLPGMLLIPWLPLRAAATSRSSD